jgi:hypothetical protein
MKLIEIKKFGGLNVADDPSNLKEGEFVELKNWRSYSDGNRLSLTTRPGRRRINDTWGEGKVRSITGSTISSIPYLFVAHGTKWKKVTTSGVATDLADITNADASQIVWKGNVLLANGTDFKKTDGTTTADVGGTPPKGKYLCLHGANVGSILFTANVSGNSSRVYWSGINDFESWNTLDDYNDLHDSDNDEITGMFSMGGNLYVFKKHQIHALLGTVPEEDRWTKLYEGVGCIAPKTICTDGDSIYFLSNDGVMKLANGLQNISLPIWNEIKGGTLNLACAAVYDNNLFLAVKTTPTEADNHRVFVCDLATLQWAEDTGKTVSVFYTFEDDRNLYSGDSVDGIIWHEETGVNDESKDGYIKNLLTENQSTFDVDSNGDGVADGWLSILPQTLSTDSYQGSYSQKAEGSLLVSVANITQGVEHCFSIYAKADNPTILDFRAPYISKHCLLDTTWQRLFVTFTPAASSATVFVECGPCYLDAAQLELGEKPTAWVPGQSSVPRALDIFSSATTSEIYRDGQNMIRWITLQARSEGSDIGLNVVCDASSETDFVFENPNVTWEEWSNYTWGELSVWPTLKYGPMQKGTSLYGNSFQFKFNATGKSKVSINSLTAEGIQLRPR